MQAELAESINAKVFRPTSPKLTLNSMQPVGFLTSWKPQIQWGKKLTIEKEIKKLKVQRIINDQSSVKKTGWSIHDETLSDDGQSVKKRENPASRWEANDGYKLKVAGFKMPIDETMKYEQSILRSSKKIKKEKRPPNCWKVLTQAVEGPKEVEQIRIK